MSFKGMPVRFLVFGIRLVFVRMALRWRVTFARETAERGRYLRVPFWVQVDNGCKAPQWNALASVPVPHVALAASLEASELAGHRPADVQPGNLPAGCCLTVAHSQTARSYTHGTRVKKIAVCVCVCVCVCVRVCVCCCWRGGGGGGGACVAHPRVSNSSRSCAI